ncbi:RES family NAD+ phosphorylase [Novosphingobium sp. BL-52-GroH]|uniref:RES family NAD+ phosphorylase n=1 Tax=Novosphingobium sp. BL-52-GroH TaxID=3349877 RepID=UPI00384CA2AF
MRYQGKLYRALNPVHAREPLSGRGAELYGGRFNPKGTPALHLATSLHTAIREANHVGDLQPTTIMAYHGDIENVLDSRAPGALDSFGMTLYALSEPTWRDQMRGGGKTATQAFAPTFMAEGFDGMLVRSFARGASGKDTNLVLWDWGTAPPSRVTLIDDDGRLSRM